MDNAVSVLLGFPPRGALHTDADYDIAVSNHLQRIDQLFRKDAATIAQQGVGILQLLDPAVNTISYLAVFNTIAESQTFAHNDKLEALVSILSGFDPRQIRYVGAQFSSLLDKVSSGTILPHDLAVELLARAILRVDPTGAMLTSHHLSLVRLAYEANVVEPAFQVTDKQIVYFPGMTRDPGIGNRNTSTVLQGPLCDLSLPPTAYIMTETGLTNLLTVDQVLQYDLTCGLMYSSRREWAKARAAFERVITHPTRDGGVSRFMTEAYSKWVLVSLLVNGRTPSVPATAGANARKTYEVLAKPYLAVASHFDSMSAVHLKQEVESNAQIWSNDRNTGLIQEVLAAHQKWQIIDLRNIHSKVSLSDIRRQTCSAETGATLPSDDDVEALIQGMIQSGLLKGVIEKPAGKPAHLKFLSESDDLSEAEYQAEIATVFAKMKKLEAIYKTTNSRLTTNSYFVKHHIREQKREKESGGQNPAATNFEAAVDDEDLMTGLTASGGI